MFIDQAAQVNLTVSSSANSHLNDILSEIVDMGQWDDILEGVDALHKKIKSVVDESAPESTGDTVQKAAILSATFYGCNIFLQRIAGVMSIHSGRPRIASAFGVGSVALSSYISLQTTEHFSPSKKPSWKFSNKRYEFVLKEKEKESILVDSDRVSLSIIAFSLLENKSFLTASPSSVITIGAHANHGNFLGYYKGSVLSTDPTATSGERAKIQKLGKKYVSYHNIFFFDILTVSILRKNVLFQCIENILFIVLKISSYSLDVFDYNCVN